MKKSRDRWPELKRAVAKDDGLPVRHIGGWTWDKLWWWNRYIEITTNALVNRQKWPHSLVYVDLFAGPGVLRLRDTRQRLPGSPLLAAMAPKPFKKILLCEKDPTLASACEARMSRCGANDRTVVFTGDCNRRIDDVSAAIPPRSLTLAFIDPTGLHANFQTLGTLTEGRQVDLLILFADRMDAIRNIKQLADRKPSRLDYVLGPKSNWRKQWQSLPNQSAEKVSQMLIKVYKEQLGTHLGYSKVTDEVLRNDRSALYRVLYASKHNRGLQFWEKSTERFRKGGRLF